MEALAETLRSIGAGSRLDLWERFINHARPASVLEIGVWKGEFAAQILQRCESITDYYMLDPWRKLPAWNKPFNVDDAVFDDVYREAMASTNFAGDRRHILRGTTTEVIDQIPDESLDFAYVDGDHTLRGITVDLTNAWRKIKPGTYLAGDDLSPTIWQHGRKFEPTLIFPFAPYFAEAVGAPFYALPFRQFLIVKPTAGRDYSFTDLTGEYQNAELRRQFAPPLKRLFS